MAPKAFQRPPDLSTKYDAAPATLEASIEAIILSQDQHHVTSKLHSGTIRHDKLQATDEEIASAKAERLARRRASNLAAGSADAAGGYEPGLELISEPPHAPQPLGDSTTTRIDR